MKTTPESEVRRDELLARIPLFSRLDKKELKKLAALCVTKTFEAGSTIVEEGGTGLGLYALISGSVEVSKKTAHEQITLATLTGGDILGEMALVDDHPRSATAVATQRTETLLITRSSFRELLAEDPEIGWLIVPTLAERIRELQERIITSELPVDADHDSSGETAPPDDAEEQTAPRDRDRTRSNLGANVLRTNYALAMAAVAGFATTLRAFEEAAHTMARETELKSMDAVPQGILSAMATAIREAEKAPERMVSAYRRHRKRE